MKCGLSPELENIFSQLIWIERRRFRIIEAVSAHFGKENIEKILAMDPATNSPLTEATSLSEMIDDRDPESLLQFLSTQMDTCEATTVKVLRQHVSVYQSHVDEQILFGARTAGQEAARSFLSKSKISHSTDEPISLSEAVQAIFALTYRVDESEKNYFLTLRPQAGATVHEQRSPHIDIWKSVGCDLKLMSAIRNEWIRGMLDILSPDIEYSESKQIEHGSPYGLAHFYKRGVHAGP